MYLSYPQDRINTQVIYRFALAQVKCTRSVLLSNSKKKIRYCQSCLARQYCNILVPLPLLASDRNFATGSYMYLSGKSPETIVNYLYLVV